MQETTIKIWDEIFQNSEWGKYPNIAIIKFIAKNFYNVSSRKDIKILELGSGPGANLWFCAREGFSVYALDGSETAMNKLIERFRKEDLLDNLKATKIGDYYTTIEEFEDETFDAIIDMESLYCNPFDRTHEIIQKCFKKLKSNGVMLSVTFTNDTYGLEGKEIDYHAVLPTVGPMANMGFGRFVTKDDIQKLYKLANNTITNIQRQELHLENNKAIKEWIIEIQKH